MFLGPKAYLKTLTVGHFTQERSLQLLPPDLARTPISPASVLTVLGMDSFFNVAASEEHAMFCGYLLNPPPAAVHQPSQPNIAPSKSIRPPLQKWEVSSIAPFNEPFLLLAGGFHHLVETSHAGRLFPPACDSLSGSLGHENDQAVLRGGSLRRGPPPTLAVGWLKIGF